MPSFSSELSSSSPLSPPNRHLAIVAPPAPRLPPHASATRPALQGDEEDEKEKDEQELGAGASSRSTRQNDVDEERQQEKEKEEE